MTVSNVNIDLATKKTQLNNQITNMQNSLKNIDGLFDNVTLSIDNTNADFADDGLYNASAGQTLKSDLTMDKIGKMSQNEIDELLKTAANPETINTEITKFQAELAQYLTEFAVAEKEIKAMEIQLTALMTTLEQAVKAQEQAEKDLESSEETAKKAQDNYEDAVAEQKALSEEQQSKLYNDAMTEFLSQEENADKKDFFTIYTEMLGSATGISTAGIDAAESAVSTSNNAVSEKQNTLALRKMTVVTLNSIFV